MTSCAGATATTGCRAGPGRIRWWAARGATGWKAAAASTCSAGADVFVFGPGEARAGASAGRIADFEPGIDSLDLGGFGLDRFLGTRAFTGRGDEVRLAMRSDHLLVQIDRDGDRVADMILRIDGLEAPLPGDLLI